MQKADEAYIVVLLGMSLDFILAVMILRCVDVRIGIGFFVKIGLGADVVLVRAENIPRAAGSISDVITDENSSISHNERTKTPMVMTLIKGYDVRRGSGKQSKPDTHGCIVHVLCRHRADCRQGEDDDDEDCPCDAKPVAELSEEPITHIERPGLEHNFRMIVEHTTEENRDDVAQVEGHCCEREDSIGSDRAGKIKQAWEDTDNRGQPDCAKRGHGLL